MQFLPFSREQYSSCIKENPPCLHAQEHVLLVLPCFRETVRRALLWFASHIVTLVTKRNLRAHQFSTNWKRRCQYG